jgi:hypothetical protein
MMQLCGCRAILKSKTDRLPGIVSDTYGEYCWFSSIAVMLVF